MNELSHAGRASRYQVLVTKWPLDESSQYAPVALRPAGRIAPRSLRDRPTTLDLKRSRISSERVEPMKFLGERFPEAGLLTPTPETSGSLTQLMLFPDFLSNQSLPTIP